MGKKVKYLYKNIINSFGNSSSYDAAKEFIGLKKLKDDTINTKPKERKRIKLSKSKIADKNKSQQEEDEEEIIIKENKNNHSSDKTLIIKNIPIIETEQDIEQFIKLNYPSAKISDIRIIKNKQGISKGFAFIDCITADNAEEICNNINNKDFDGNIITCAVSKPPSLGENDKRTIFINNLSFKTEEGQLRSIFEKYGPILDIRIIRDHITNKPKGFGYIEYANEASADAALQGKGLFNIDGRTVIAKRSESNSKIREKLKNVAHVSNFSFSFTEDKLKEFFVKNGVDKINDLLILRDSDGNSKGFGFIELEDEVLLLY